MLISSDSMSLKTVASRLAHKFLPLFLLPLVLAAPVGAIVYTYDNTTSGATAYVTNDGNCDSGTGALNRTFVVSDSFTVASIALGLNISHNNRGDYRIRLEAPGGTAFDFIALTGDQRNNYDIQMSSNSDGAGVPALDDGTADPVGEPYFARLVNIAGADFYTGDANGTWTLRVCDRNDNNVNGTFNRARLILTSTEVVPSVCTSTVSYEWEANGNNNAFTNVTVGGVTLTLTSTRDLTADGANTSGRNNFTTQTGTFGNQVGYYIMQFDDGAVGPLSPEAVLLESTWTFNPPVRYQTWRHLDIDNGSWEDYVRVRGLDAASATVPYSLTLGPVHQLSGDIIETDGTNVEDTSTDGNVDYSFARPIASIVAEYMRGDDDADPNSQRIGIGSPSFCAFDYGDAPSTYGTLLAGGARHILQNRELWLGANRPDGESDGQPAGGAATADDLAAVGGVDDEDGVASFPACPNNGTYSVTVSASDVRTSGANGAIRGYIDWNRDGDFADANEISAATAVPRTNADPTNYSVTWGSVPSNCGGTATTFARFRFSTDTAAVASPTGLAPDGEVEDHQITAATLPVTLASVESVRASNSMSVRFSTVSETSNAGFRIWGTTLEGKKVLLTTVKSESADSFAPRHYVATVAGLGVTAIQIEDVSLFGDNRWHGPFAVGSTFGEEPEADEIDWASIRSDSGVTTALDRMRSAELAGDAGVRGIGSFKTATSATRNGLLLVRDEGIHRVTHEQLHAAGIDLSGVSAARIAVIDNGAGVPRYIETSGGAFGPGSYIEFVARPSLTLASPVDVYVLRVDPSKAITVTSTNPGRGGPGVSTAVDRHRPDRNYSSSSVNGDPWYDDRVFSWGAPATLSRAFDLPDLAGGAASLKIRTWGYGDFPGAAPDHHVVVRLNGIEIAQGVFDGASIWEPSLDVSDLVSASGNVLEIDVPGDTGYDFDYIGFEGFDVTYDRATVARSERFQGAVPRMLAFTIGGFASGEPVAVWKVSGNTMKRDLRQPARGSVVAAGGPGDVYAASQSALYSPGIAPRVPAGRLKSTAEYLIVTHPSLADATADLVALEESRGFTTEVVTTDNIFAAYSDHASSAEALKSFLSASQAQGNLQYVLLVGADTSDPYDHLGNGSVSFVPTDYRNFIPRVSFSPTDESLVDRDGDGVGDLPIGRLPVRTPAEIDAVVAKLYAWEAAITSARPSALLAAGLSDGDRAIASVNEAYAASLPDWNTVLAQVDNSSTAAVRQQVLDGINAGAHLVSFVGHSSPGQWDLTPILRWQDVATLTNAGLPNLFTAWGCWNSYYVEPTIESLSARLLRQPDAGAAGAIGATTLTTEASHRLLGTLFFARVNAGASTVGEAFHGAKQDLATQGGAADAIYGMTLLGDPAMSLPHLD